MRMKALGVALMVGFAAFTTFYWIIDAPRRENFEANRDEELLEFGQIVFLPDDTYTIEILLTPDGFLLEADDPETPTTWDPVASAVSELPVMVNTSASFKNDTGGDVTLTGQGQRPFEVVIEDTQSAPVKFDEEGETTIAGEGVEGSLLVTAGPPHLAPYGANCARCHGIEGMGGPIPGDSAGRSAPSLHSLPLAQKWASTGGAQGLNNYVSWVITLGGVVRSGDIFSPMPAWGQDFGGPLTRQQIEALTAMIGEWAAETLSNPPPDEVPNTVEAGAQVYTEAGCGGCHGADLAGVPGTFPSLQTVGTSLSTDLPTPVSNNEQRLDDYATDQRMFFELWIRDSSGNYNDGNATGMPSFPEDQISASRLEALITFLQDQTE